MNATAAIRAEISDAKKLLAGIAIADWSSGRKIGKAKVKEVILDCENRAAGCEWRGTERQQKFHECRYDKLLCASGCSESYERYLEAEHIPFCPMHKESCSQCGRPGIVSCEMRSIFFANVLVLENIGNSQSTMRSLRRKKEGSHGATVTLTTRML